MIGLHIVLTFSISRDFRELDAGISRYVWSADVLVDMSGYWDIPEGTDCARKAWLTGRLGAAIGENLERVRWWEDVESRRPSS